MSLSRFFECDLVLSKAALSCSGMATQGGLLALISVAIGFVEDVVSMSVLCLVRALLLTLDEPLMAGGGMWDLSQVSSMTLVEMNVQADPPSLRTGQRQWWIRSPELLTSSITAKLISNLDKMSFSVSDDKAVLLSGSRV